jgi:DNA-binding transcriptional LysR family regulator
VELADLEVFLILAEELHFGRTATRAHVSPARISQRIQALERHVGAALFERTSRRVVLTPLGDQLRQDLTPAHAALLSALSRAREAARSPAGTLRIGFTETTAGSALDQLIEAFEQAQPDCTAVLREVRIFEPLMPLRTNEIDVVINWLIFDEPDLTLGPVLSEYPRMLAVGVNHPLAGSESVSAEVLADYPLTNWQSSGIPKAALEHMVPSYTPSGLPTRLHPTPVRTAAEGASLIARGQTVHPTIGTYPIRGRSDLTFIPIVDLPPLPLGLIWCTAHENARIRALAEVARTLRP